MKYNFLCLWLFALPVLSACVSDPDGHDMQAVNPTTLSHEDRETRIAVDVILGRLHQVQSENDWQSLSALRPEIYQLATGLLSGGPRAELPPRLETSPVMRAPGNAMGQTPESTTHIYPASAPKPAPASLPTGPAYSKPPVLENSRSMFFAVQLGSYKSTERAFAGWDELQARSPQSLHDLHPRVEQVDLGSKGIFLRLKAGPLSSEVDVSSRCRLLIADGINCSRADFTGLDRS